MASARVSDWLVSRAGRAAGALGSRNQKVVLPYVSCDAPPPLPSNDDDDDDHDDDDDDDDDDDGDDNGSSGGGGGGGSGNHDYNAQREALLAHLGSLQQEHLRMEQV